jgi:hypothetical protein
LAPSSSRLLDGLSLAKADWGFAGVTSGVERQA